MFFLQDAVHLDKNNRYFFKAADLNSSPSPSTSMLREMHLEVQNANNYPMSCFTFLKWFLFYQQTILFPGIYLEELYQGTISKDFKQGWSNIHYAWKIKGFCYVLLPMLEINARCYRWHLPRSTTMFYIVSTFPNSKRCPQPLSHFFPQVKSTHLSEPLNKWLNKRILNIYHYSIF